MKNTILLAGAILINAMFSFSQVEPLNVNAPNRILPIPRKIQMAILFDASGSMDGLLSQAKARIWTIVNELTTLRYEGQTPSIEIALYQYGHDGIPAANNHVLQLVPLSSDLDLISKNLFGITTNGGSEYCGAVIGKSISDLAWSSSPTDLKMIYIAGNEIFNQGTIDYREVCKTAATRQIFINTIYCGPYEQGIKELWFDGAKIGQGDYFNIDANKEILQIVTPYDDKINTYNKSLNNTYYGYGASGATLKAEQITQDAVNYSFSSTNNVERAIVKSSAAYTNSSWDLIDAEKAGKIKIEEIKEDELPNEFKGKTIEEKTVLLDEKKNERDSIQIEIGKLAEDRKVYIETEMKKRATDGTTDDFGSSVNQSILKKAAIIGMKKEGVK